MKNILGIIGSPRKLGNSEIMIKEISRNIALPHNLQLVRLSDFNLLPCKACYQCLFNNKECVLDDEFNNLLNLIKNSDALIVAAPTYFLSANSSLKRFIDRGITFYANLDKLWGKPAIGIGIAGMKGKEGYTLLDIQNFLSILFADIKKIEMIFGALPGEIFLNNKNKKTAGHLAASLFTTMPEKKEPHYCPLCGGDTFRFTGKNQVICMLCSNSGTMAIENSLPVFKINKSSHNLFLSKDDALKHLNWVMGMKEKFNRKKTELKKITAIYKD